LVVFVLVLLSDVLGVEVFLLAPTASGGDGAGPRFCAPLPPSPPSFPTHFLCIALTNFRKAIFFSGGHFFSPFFSLSEGTYEVTVESGGNFEDYIRFLFCHLFGPVNHGQNWKGWERSGENDYSDNQA
jgi:hypothetical protein